MAILSAPTIIISIDNSVDISIFYGINEEEEQEDFKLLPEISSNVAVDAVVCIPNNKDDIYTLKKYHQPHLNLVLPPPELVTS